MLKTKTKWLGWPPFYILILLGVLLLIPWVLTREVHYSELAGFGAKLYDEGEMPPLVIVRYGDTILNVPVVILQTTLLLLAMTLRRKDK